MLLGDSAASRERMVATSAASLVFLAVFSGVELGANRKGWLKIAISSKSNLSRQFDRGHSAIVRDAARKLEQRFD